VSKKIVLLALLLAVPVGLKAQVVAAATGGTASIFVGGTYTFLQTGYTGYDNWLQGIGGYGDFNLNYWFAAEAEARLLRINQQNSVHEDTYLIGPKFTHRYHKYEPYGKVLLGVGEINFPYSYAHGGYFAMAFGGGLDYRLTPRLKIRAIDFEYQKWPGFLNNTTLSPYGFSIGASYRVFK
jgi:hypothetical protein